MKIELMDFKELENGGAILSLESDEEGKRYLINYAIMDLIKKGLYEIEELHNDN
jgi:hypothetical protein